ncbi:MAG: PDZ domain-containing protein [Terracidiphilus sp.]
MPDNPRRERRFSVAIQRQRQDRSRRPDGSVHPKANIGQSDHCAGRGTTALVAHGSRSELTYLSTEMLGEITIGHMFVEGPHQPDKGPKGGLLGADYTTENGRYRIAKILGGQNWTPGLASPLTLPGVSVKEGEYLLAVNGRELHADDDLYQFFDGTAGKQTVLRVGTNPDGKDARDVTVVPIADEDGLRNLDWIEANRHKVNELSGGKVA